LKTLIILRDLTILAELPIFKDCILDAIVPNHAEQTIIKSNIFHESLQYNDFIEINLSIASIVKTELNT
jgi:hypothetical protein